LEYVQLPPLVHNTLTLNLQMVKCQGWDAVAAGFPLIRAQVHRDALWAGRTTPELRFLFIGVASLKRMVQLAGMFSDAAFTNTTAHCPAQRHVYLQRDGTRLIKEPVDGRPDLILGENVSCYREFVASMNGQGSGPQPPPAPADSFQATPDEVVAALGERFGFDPRATGGVFELLAVDETILAAFQAWLHTGGLDPSFRGSFPAWPRAECVPHPILGQLLDTGADPVDAFQHLAHLARRVDEEI
jgi:hypothetical protein